MAIGIRSLVHYLPGETLDVKKYYAYLQPEIKKLPETEQAALTELAPDTVHRLKDPSALEILGLIAGQRSIDRSGLDPSEIDGLIVAQSGGKQFMPLTASYLQLNLGLGTLIIARNVCDGDVSLLSGLNLARIYVKSGLCKNVLVIGAAALIGGKYGFGVDLTEPWCMHFGDGAAACIVTEGGSVDFELRGFHFETESVSCRLTGTLNGDFGTIRAPRNRDLCFSAEMDDKFGAYMPTRDEKLLPVAAAPGFITKLLSSAVQKAGLSGPFPDHIIPAHFAELNAVWEEELSGAGVKPGAVKHFQKAIGHAGNADTLIDMSILRDAGAIAPGETTALISPCSGVQSAVLILEKR